MTSVATESLPISQSTAPTDAHDVAATVAAAHQRGQPIYPVGGGTSLNYGRIPTQRGLALSLTGLNRVIDYPARDMTVTVEAGVTLAQLAECLAREKQWLPIDVPDAARATIGGVVATAWCGARRYGCGTPRDYVIGISAVDGRGMAFKGGGRVVKNVAGYDLCKLLTGSLGTLGIVTQVTLKIRPLPEASAFAMCQLGSWSDAERLLAALVHSATTPSAIELLSGPYWRDHAALGTSTAGSVARVAVGVEGTSAEVEWMLGQLPREWRELGILESHLIDGVRAEALWCELAEFSAAPDVPLAVKASVLAGRSVEFVQQIRECDADASIQVHCGDGVVIARFSKFDAADVSRLLVGRLQPAATLAGGHMVVLSSGVEGLTRQAVWGGAVPGAEWMTKVKAQFDPKGLLNPGRFVFAD